MKKSLTFIDYINHNTFISITDGGDYFTLFMKSLPRNKGWVTLDGVKGNEEFYKISFLKENL